MNIIRGKTIHGKIYFKDNLDISLAVNPTVSAQKHAKFIAGNKQLSKLAPTHYTTLHKIIDCFKRKFASLFTFVDRPDVKNFHQFLFASKEAKLPFHVVLQHYQDFITKDMTCPEALKKCLENFNSDIKEKNAIKVAARSAKSNDQKKKFELSRQAYFSKKMKELQTLKPGEVRLFELNGIAYLWSQHKGKYTLQMVGSYQCMQAFNLKTFPLAGQNKVERTLIFENIPAEVLFKIKNVPINLDTESQKNAPDPHKNKSKAEAWIQAWAEGTQKSEQQTDWLNDLAVYRKQSTSIEQMGKQNERCDKVFWNVIAAAKKAIIQPEKIEIPLKKQHKQIKLRAQLLGLFEVFRKQQHALHSNSESFEELLALHKNVAATCLQAYRKKSITPQEFEEIRVELDSIASALAQATPLAPASFSKLKLKNPEIHDAKLEMLGAKVLPLPTTPQNLELKETFHSKKNLKAPAACALAPLPGFSMSTASPYVLDSKEAFLEHLRSNLKMQDKKAAEHQLLKLFTEISFSPFSKKDERNLDSFWWKFSEEEKQEVMTAIHTFCKELFFGKDKNEIEKIHKELTQFQHDAFLKMTLITYFLESVYNHHNEYDFLTNISLLDYLTGYSGSTCNRYRNLHMKNFNPEHSYRKTIGSSSRMTYELLNTANSMHSISYNEQSKAGKASPLEIKNLFSYKQGRIFNFHSASTLDRPSFFSRWFPGYTKNWIRPINHPFLAALYRNASSFVFQNRDLKHEQKYGSISPIQETYGVLTPESFQTQPQAVFDEVKKTFEELQKNKKIDFAFEETLLFSAVEQQALLRILRDDCPQFELLAFLKEFPHLFRHASVRNYFDALFFNTSLYRTFGSHSEGVVENTFPQQIQESIQQFELQIEEALTIEPQKDPELLKQRFEALVYLYEAKEKLRRVYENHYQYDHASNLMILKPLSTQAFEPSLEKIQRLRHLALTDKRLALSIAPLAQLALTLQFDQEKITAEMIPEVIFNYMLVSSAQRDSANIDPAVEEELNRRWKDLVLTLKQQQKLPLESVKYTLDYMCYLKGLSSKGEWKQETLLKFSNKEYCIDLETMTLSPKKQKNKTVLQDTVRIELLPDSIVKNPSFCAKFPALKDQAISAHKQILNGETVYTFVDEKKRLYHLAVEEENHFRYYVEGKMGGQTKLLQEGSLKKLEENFNEKMAKLQKEMIEKESIFSKIVNGVKLHKGNEHFSECMHTFPSIFSSGFYMDPQNSMHGYTLNAQHEVLLEVIFKETKTGLAIDHVIDHREKSLSVWQVNNAHEVKQLDFLKKIENPDQILIWSQKGQVKKVELPRYGLTFVLQQGNWKCTTGDLKGYKIVLNASQKQKQGVDNSLLLTPSDPALPKKWLVPDCSTVFTSAESMTPKARGWLGKLILIIEKLQFFYKIAKQFSGKDDNVEDEFVPKILKNRYTFNPTPSVLNYSTFDLRHYTDEIIVNEENKIPSLLNIVAHLLKTNQAAFAYPLIQKMDLKKYATHPPTLKLLSQFMNGWSNNPLEAAFKFKLGYSLYHALSKQQQTTKELRQKLRELMLRNAKTFLGKEHKLPAELRMDSNERIHLAVIAQKLDPKFYAEHLQVHLLAEDSYVTPHFDAVHFSEVKKSWKTKRSQLNYDDEIKALEKKLCPLTTAELSDPLPHTEGTSLLFSEKEIAKLFKPVSRQLPTLKLPKDPILSLASKNALEAFQKDVDTYRTQEMQRPLFEIQAGQKELENFANKQIKPKLRAFIKEANALKREIYHCIHTSECAEDQLAIYSSEKSVARLDALREALASDSLNQLQQNGKLHSTVDVAKLKQMLINYYDLLSKHHAAMACIKALKNVDVSQKNKNPEMWQSISTSLYRLLTIQRYYDPAKDPRPLIFEGQQFIHFRSLDGGLHQIDLLDTLMRNPTQAIQAPTGAGKTSVLSVMRSLLKANGKNLVIQKVTSPLYLQTYQKLKEVLGDLFGRTVYPFQFDLSQPMVKTIIQKFKDENGIEKEVPTSISIFKIIYSDMLDVIHSRGCILTDYKSLPLVEEKFWKLAQEMLELQENGQPIGALQREHFTYLKKILNLLTTRADENMDEFDQPNRPIHKIQIDLGIGSHPIPPSLAEDSIEIYQLLLKDPILQLKKNIQADLSEKMRLECIHRAATQMASQMSQAQGIHQQRLLDYFLGKDESVLTDLKERDPKLLDKIAFCKDQFTTYLPLTLRGKRKSHYTRSEDGLRTIPCFNGSKHEAKRGTIIEEINYTIQDYFQGGISLPDYQSWAKELKRESEELAINSPRLVVLQKELEQMLPGRAFVDLTDPKLIKKHIREINTDPAKIVDFLKTRLNKLKTSGAVISMGPQDIIYMNRANSGMSATMGAAESLHSNFKVDLHQKGTIRANMALRVCQRAKSNTVLTYNPLKPTDVLKAAQHKADISAVIDGAGLFNENPQAAVKQLFESSHVTQIGYHQAGKMVYEGDSTAELKNQGLVFTQENTRGTDLPLAADACALLTLAENDSIGDFFQKEGRLRLETQRYVLAVSHYQNPIKSIPHAIARAICVEAELEGKDIFRKCKQEQQAIVRQEMKTKLLSMDSVEEFLDQFKNPMVSTLFVTPPATHYSKPGDYFKTHSLLRKENCDPKSELEVLRQKMLKLAENLQLPQAKMQLLHLDYSASLLAKMPAKVPSLNSVELEMEHEVEVEVEQELQVEQQLEIEVEKEQELQQAVGASSCIRFPLRMSTKLEHPLSNETDIPYDNRIFLSDAFMPFSRRNTASLLKREMWDSSMYRVGIVQLYFKHVHTTKQEKIGSRTYIHNVSATPKLKGVTITDPLPDNKSRWDDNGWIRGKHRCSLLEVDLRTGQLVRHIQGGRSINEQDALTSEETVRVLAQIKFLDGRTCGYSPQEIESLKQWINKNGKEKMRAHLLEVVLRYRQEERKRFVGSQLEIEIFT